MPSLSHFFGLKPWEIDALTYREAGAYLDWLADYAEAQSQAAK